jgi:gamma-glutamyltranspeptidase/glutathione hydrolase
VPKIIYPLFVALFLVFSCRQAPAPPSYVAQKTLQSDSAIVVSPHPIASDVGIAILKQGGNAVDAAVAVQFALAVVFPRAGNLGGGGFMVIRENDGESYSIDYREKAPMAASRDMYLDAEGEVIPGLSRNGHLAVGVPGSVAGLLEAHRRLGKIKDLSVIIQPAIDLAQNGFQLSQAECDRLISFQEAFLKYNSPPNPFLKDTFLLGERFRQKKLARTLELIKTNGRAGFYDGPVAQAIVEEMKENKGLISLEDLKVYRPKWRDPIEADYKNYRIISMAPPSSGGIALVQMLEMVEPYSLKEMGFHSSEAVHLMAEAERRAFADRAKYLGDEDYYKVPKTYLLSDKYLKGRMATFQTDQATQTDSAAGGKIKLVKESFETTHTSIVDTEGNAVSVTTTLNSNYGSKVWVDGAGFFLNNEMDDFSAKPGVPNQFGLLGAEANAIAPGKRMLSSMTPTIIEKDGELFMVLGAPGGSTIITAVFQVFLNVVEFGLSLEEAVNACRFHHQWLPDHILIEQDCLDETTRQQLKDKGHTFKEIKRMAVIKAILRTPDGKLQGAADPRNPDDDVSGW